MIAFTLLLAAVLTSWLVSASLVPVVLAGATLFLSLITRSLGLSTSRVMAASFVSLQFVLAMAFEKSGWFPPLFEPLGFAWHLAIAIFTWNAILRDSVDNPPSVALAGGLLLFWAASNAEIFRFNPWLVRSLGALPLAITLVREWVPRRCPWSPTHLIALLGLAFLLGLASIQSNWMSQKLTYWFGGEEIYQYQLEADEFNPNSRTVNLGGDDGVVHLPRQADITSDDQTRFFLTLNSIEDFLTLTRRPIYLRVSTVSIFENDDRILPSRVGKWILDSDDGAADDYTVLPERKPAKEMTYSIILPRSSTDQIPLLEGTSKIQGREVFHHSECRYQLYQEGSSPWTRYTALGAREILRYSGTGFTPGWAPSSSPYLQMPPSDLAERIRRLTSSVTHTTLAPEAAIANYLKRFQYSLKYKNPSNLSPVENFLFGEKKGHCELFASATALMLRAAGIPSRIAYGYTGGVSNRELLAIAFRSSDIHAWAEILDHRGNWQIFETTPPDRGPSRLAKQGAKGTINWALASFHPDGTPQTEAATRQLSFWEHTLPWMQAHWIYLSVGSFFFMGAAFYVLRNRARNRLERHGPESLHYREGGASSRPEYIDSLLQWGRSQGIERTPGQTLREYLFRLEEKNISGAYFSEIVEYFYRTRYAQESRDPAKEKLFLRTLRKLGK